MATCVNGGSGGYPDPGGCTGRGRGAYGYWGRSVYKSVYCNQIYQKEIALLEDQINGTGLRANLWRGVTSGNLCSCYKESNRASDRKCKSCHANLNGYVPGYFKFGYTTFWMSSVDDGLVFSDTEIVEEFKSAKVQLSGDALEGWVESVDFEFQRNAIGSVWEYDVAAFRQRGDDASVSVQYSLDSGLSWESIETLPVNNPAEGIIRFRAFLSRTSSDIRSPLFEIVRARFAYIDLSGQLCDGSYAAGPFIKVMKSDPQTNLIKSDYGDVSVVNGLKFWTGPLSMFDPSIPKNSSRELLEGPNVIIELLDGVFAGKRFIVIDWTLSDPGGFKVVTQNFSMRAEVDEGPYSLVW